MDTTKNILTQLTDFTYDAPTYPIILRSDFFNVKETKRIAKEFRKGCVSIKTLISKEKAKCRKAGKVFSYGFLVGMEVVIVNDIELVRQDYLEKKNKCASNTRRNNKRKGLMDNLDVEILKHRYNTFRISSATTHYCMLQPMGVLTEEEFKVYFPEILVRKTDIK